MRFVPLSFTQNAGALEVQTVANPNLVPPGYYMLFLINSAGVPSVAEFVRFPAGHEDSEPPTAPGNLTVTGSVDSVSLTWDAAADNAGVAGYEVHRATVTGFVPSAATRVAQPTTTDYTDAGLPAGTYYYRVIAVDIAGNASLPSGEASVTIIGDVTSPTVALTSPADGAPVSAMIEVSATALDNVGVAGVQFTLDGGALGAEDTTAPYSYTWNTGTVPNACGEEKQELHQREVNSTGKSDDAVKNGETSEIFTLSFRRTPIK